jgi:hypothetical protein
VLPQIRFEDLEGQFRMLRMVPVHHLVVRNDDDHRDGLSFGQEVVHDEIGAAVVDPVGRQLAAAA